MYSFTRLKGKQGKKLRKLTVITLAITIIFGSFFNLHVLADENKKDLNHIQKQREQIKQNLSGAEKEVSAVMSEIDVLNDEISQVEKEILNNQALIRETEDKINQSIKDIEKLHQEINQLETDIEKRYEILDKRIASYQKNGGHINYLEVLFGAQNFSDFISRVTMVNTITKSDSELITQLEDDIKAVEEKKILALEKLDSLNDMKLEQEETLAKVQDQMKENEQRKASLQSKQTKLLKKIEKLKSEDNSLSAMESKVRKQIAQAEAAKQVKLEHKNSHSTDSQGTVKSVEGKTIKVIATAYTANCKGCSGVTSTGIDLKSNPDTKVIAVDPTVIPLGSVVYVEGYGYAIAGDTGSAIKGNKIDVFVPTRAKALQWGIRRVNVTIK